MLVCFLFCTNVKLPPSSTPAIRGLPAWQDKGNRRVTLRPELTPSLARLVLQRGKGLALPAKWFAIGQCWRYERATRGRRREHYQWNMDIVGVPGVEAVSVAQCSAGFKFIFFFLAAKHQCIQGLLTSAFHQPTRIHASMQTQGHDSNSLGQFTLPTLSAHRHNAEPMQEAELLAAISTFFSRVGLTSADVGIKVSSRKVLQRMLSRFGVSDASFGPVCVIVDKMEKIPQDKVESELRELGVAPEAVDGILQALSLRTVEELEGLLGAEDECVEEMRRLFALAEGYGYADWLVFDASVVRGLAYYTGACLIGCGFLGMFKDCVLFLSAFMCCTSSPIPCLYISDPAGIVFEGFDRAGQLRAICGGGRYDRLLGTFGGENQPCAGFGFGDAVIVELLKDKSLLPELKHEVGGRFMFGA